MVYYITLSHFLLYYLPLLSSLFLLFSSVTSVPSTDESAICLMRSVYRFVFRVCASSYPVSKHTVSLITQTSWFVLFHTTMSGRWSVVAMWGGKT